MPENVLSGSGKVSVKGRSFEPFSTPKPLHFRLNVIISLARCLLINTLLSSWPGRDCRNFCPFLPFSSSPSSSDAWSKPAPSVVSAFWLSLYNLASILRPSPVLLRPFLPLFLASLQTPHFFLLWGHQWLCSSNAGLIRLWRNDAVEKVFPQGCQNNWIWIWEEKKKETLTPT